MRAGQRAQARPKPAPKVTQASAQCHCCAERWYRRAVTDHTTSFLLENHPLHPVARVVLLLTWALESGTYQAGRSGEEGRKGKGSGCWLLGPNVRAPTSAALVIAFLLERSVYTSHYPSILFRDRTPPVCAFPLPGMRQH
ncbi:hypothetical protein D0864_16078 [Hortaea werneckii]|uniref:Uncharacterized protein n=1 Tax=Hortaea werneckii TaxID=91943 RepID=A0A3M7BS38_HORWE|nr:hypothetical protein D0864_16078 [Hortaea werneckii]